MFAFDSSFHSFIPSPASQHYKTFLLYRAFHCFISLRLSLLIQYHLGHSFAASQPLSVDQFSDHFSSTITAKSSTFIPYIGPVIINGILYTPSEPLTPKDSQSLKEVDHPQEVEPTPEPDPPQIPASVQSFHQEVLQPEVKSSSHSQSFVPAPTRDIQTQTDFPIYNPVLVILPSAAIMPGPQFGALGATFTVVRAMQFVSLIAIIGMTSNFIDQMVKLDQKPPSVLIGTLSVVSLLTSPSNPSSRRNSNKNFIDGYHSPLRPNLLRSLLGLHAPLLNLHRPRLHHPHRRHRRRRHGRQAPLLPRLRSPLQLRRQHLLLPRLRRREHEQGQLLGLGRRLKDDLFRAEEYLGSEHCALYPVCV